MRGNISKDAKGRKGKNMGVDLHRQRKRDRKGSRGRGEKADREKG